MVAFVVDGITSKQVAELSIAIFKTLCKDALGHADTSSLSESEWKPIASQFTIYDADDFEWEEGVFPVFMGDGLALRFTGVKTKRHGKVLEHGEFIKYRYGTLPDADRVLKLSRIRDGKARSEYATISDLILRYRDIATGNEPVSTMTSTQFVFGPTRLEELIGYCRVAGEVCFDFETKPKYLGLKKKEELKKASLDFNRSLPTMLGISFQIGGGWVIPLYHHHSPWDIGCDDKFAVDTVDGDSHMVIIRDGEERKVVKYNGKVVLESEDPDLFEIVRENVVTNLRFALEHGYKNLVQDYLVPRLNTIFADPEIRKVAHNFKFDYKIGRKLGLDFQGRADDTILLDHYIREDREHGLKDIAARYYPEFSGYDDDVDYANGDIITLGEYCAKDNDLTLRLSYILEEELMADWQSYNCYRSLETLKTAMLCEMEWGGMKVDRKVMAENLLKVVDHIQQKEGFINSHPVVKKFVASKTSEGSDARIAELERKIAEVEGRKIKELRAKPLPKAGTKAHTVHVRKVELVEGRQYYAQDYPYTVVKTQAMELHRLQAGEGREVFVFNLASTQQLGELIYTHPHGLRHRMPVTIKSRKNKETGRTEKVKEVNPDTGKDQLLQLKDDSGLIDAIVELGILQSLKGTFLEGIADTMDLDDCVHSSFNTVKSHRLSSNNPNLQNIPSRTKAEDLKGIVAAIKRMFIPHVDDPDYIFFQADLSQAELRWIGYLWQIRSMIAAFKADQDLHILASCNANNLTVEQYWEIKKTDPKRAADLRQVGKANNFGLCFKASPMGYQNFAKTQYGLDLTLTQAEHHHAAFFKLHPDIPKAHRLYEAKALKFGHVRTAFGVRRHVPNIADANPRYRSADERVAVNSPVQGSSGQGLLYSLVVFEMRMKMLYGSEWRRIGRIVNSVHDSAIGWLHKLHADSVLGWLVKSMNNPTTEQYFGFDFKDLMMKTDVEVGKNWKDLEPYAIGSGIEIKKAA